MILYQNTFFCYQKTYFCHKKHFFENFFRRRPRHNEAQKNLARFLLAIFFPSRCVSGQFCSGQVPANFFLAGSRPGFLVGGTLFGEGGTAAKMTPLIYPLVKKRKMGHETGCRGSYCINSDTNLHEFLSW